MDVRRAFLLFGIYLVAASVNATADQQILSRDSKVVVEKDGDLPRLGEGRKAPTREKWLSRWLTNREHWRLLILILVASFLSYFIVWLFLGRGSTEERIVLRNLPPEGLSAGAVAYLARMERFGSYDNTCFSAGVIGLAAKGAIRIEKTAGGSPIPGASGYGYVIHAEKKQHESDGERAALTPDESWLLEDLLGTAPDLQLSQENHAQILEAQIAHQVSLYSQQKALNLRLNDSWILPGVLLSVGVTLIILFGIEPWAGGFLAFFGGLMQFPFKLCPRHYALNASLFAMLFVALIMSGCVLFIDDEELGSWSRRIDLSLALAFSALVYAGNLGARFLLKAPTRIGRQMLDQLEGFRLYLADEIPVEDPKRDLRYRESQATTFERPEHTLGLFEKFLPYAVALNCAEQWASQFENPEKCHLANPLGDFGAAFTAVLAAAAVKPENSGGSGGG